MLPNAVVELLPISPLRDLETLIEMTCATCASKQTRRAYRSQLSKFILSGHPLNREGVALYLQKLRDEGLGSASIISASSAIRKLASEAEIRGLITRDELSQLRDVKPGRHFRTRAGNWLTIAQVQRYLNLPDRKTYWGQRDACLLSLMVGCGFRRAEMAALKWESYQQRDGRPCFVDIVGKGNKRRTLPVPVWAAGDVDRWRVTSAGEPPSVSPELAYTTRVRPRDPAYVLGGMTDVTVYRLCAAYGEREGLNIAPHDLRRTLAKLLRKSGAAIEQIQHTLGHEDISTTAMYLGSDLELGEGLAAVDLLKLRAPLVPVAPGAPPEGGSTISATSPTGATHVESSSLTTEPPDAS